MRFIRQMRFIHLSISCLIVLGGCLRQAVSVRNLVGIERVEILYYTSDGRWVSQDSLSWHDRSVYRQINFDTDCDGSWNYSYAEVYDNVAGWIWIPSSARINPLEEPELARKKQYLVRDRSTPYVQPSLDDFGYDCP